MCSSQALKIADAMDFFRYRQGTWASWRVTHHLAFRRSESGESAITMKVLDADDQRIVDLCKQWEVDPALAQGGCYVTWNATLDWDQEGENHEGETVFALVPEKDDIRRGRILRDRGYAEIVPIAGTFHLDEDDNLNLETPYEGGAVIEHFKFDGKDTVNRLSTVKRFGGFSNVTFASEQRVILPNGPELQDLYHEEVSSAMTDEEKEEADRIFEIFESMQIEGQRNDNISYDDFRAQLQGFATEHNEKIDDDDDDGEVFTDEELFECLDESFLTVFKRGFCESEEEEKKEEKPGIRTSRWGATAGTSSQVPANSAFSSGFGVSRQGPPSTRSAFPTGFVESPPVSSDASDNGTEDGNDTGPDDALKTIEQLAANAGIDLSKIPPSMRDDFLATFESERKSKEK